MQIITDALRAQHLKKLYENNKIRIHSIPKRSLLFT